MGLLEEAQITKDTLQRTYDNIFSEKGVAYWKFRETQFHSTSTTLEISAYDSNGNKLLEESRDRNNKLIRKEKFRYDKNGTKLGYEGTCQRGYNKGKLRHAR